MNDMNTRPLAVAVRSQVEACVLAIPAEWESITRSELIFGGSLDEKQAGFLLGLDVLYCGSTEQESHYRDLLARLRSRQQSTSGTPQPVFPTELQS